MTNTTGLALRRQVLLWTWGSRLLLVGVLALAASELFVFKGFLFRLATPAAAYAAANPPEIPVQAKEGEQAGSGESAPQQFDPRDPRTVPEARLPKALATAEMVALIKDVKTLTDDLKRLAKEAPEYSKSHGEVNTPEVRDGLWDRLVSKGFDEVETPLLWYHVAGGRAGTLASEGIQAIAIPVGNVRARILGGVATTADAAYINAVRSWLDPHLRWLDEKQKEMGRLRQLIGAEGVSIPKEPSFFGN